MNRDNFYFERDKRTAQYGVIARHLERPVTVYVGDDAAETISGQIAVLALVNMLARVHRRIRIHVRNAELILPSIVPASTLDGACHDLISAIDPYNDLYLRGKGFRAPSKDDLSIAVGHVTKPVGMAIGAERYVGYVTRDTATFTDDGSSIMGAGLAACLGAAALMRQAVGDMPTLRRASLWNFQEQGNADYGPRETPGPINVGSVAVIGAGAVGSALSHWVRFVGYSGKWEFVDHDVVELHNTNRTLGLLAADAGWINGNPGSAPSMKSTAAARLIGAESFEGSYEQWVGEASTFDLLIPVANGPGVRRLIAVRGEPILIHAGTSKNWTADLYRHLPEKDGCIVCRIPETVKSDFKCSAGRLPNIQTESSDAALPFLSGAAGLLLLAALVHLQDGSLMDFRSNHWRLLLDLNPNQLIMSSNYKCHAKCTLYKNLPQSVRRELHRGKRWAHLD